MIVHEWTDAGADAGSDGVAFGTVWRTQLAAARDSYLELFAQSGVPAETARGVAASSRGAVEEFAPTVAAELQGMATGSGLDVLDLHLLTARTEILAHAAPARECSTIVHVPADGSAPRTLQTWDWLAGLSNETVVRRLHGAGVVTFCEFGQPAKIGVNDRGLGLHVNILHHGSDGSQAGVPVHVLARLILERASTVAEAADIARSVPLAASSVFTVATAGAAAAIEVCPSGVAFLTAGPGDTIAHTNHFLDAELARGEAPVADTTTTARLDCLVDHADLAALDDAHARAIAFGRVPDAPISERADENDPPHERWETKLTVSLDVAGAALEFAAGSPLDVAAGAAWRRVAHAAAGRSPRVP